MQLRNRQGRLTDLGVRISAFARPCPKRQEPTGTRNPRHPNETGHRLLQAGLTQVAVVGSGTGGGFNLVAGSVHEEDRHDIKHLAPKDSAFVEIEHEIHRRQFETVAEMARTLADTPEPTGEGSMLDNTLIVWIGDNGEQHHSTATEFPVVLIGGESLGLTSAGKTIVYPGLDEANHHQLSNLWNTVGHLAGQDLKRVRRRRPKPPPHRSPRGASAKELKAGTLIAVSGVSLPNVAHPDTRRPQCPTARLFSASAIRPRPDGMLREPPGDSTARRRRRR